MSFFAELKRRNVFRVAAAYAVVAWLLIEVSDTIFPRLGLPDWTVTFVIVLLLLGFPLALFFAWAYELTPEGLKRERDVDRSESITPQTGRKLDRVIIGILALALGFFAVDRFLLEPRRDGVTLEQLAEQVEQARQEGQLAALESEDTHSIAVLAFQDMSPDRDQEYLSDGIADELLNLLARVPELRVISRSSAFSFKGQNLEIPEIAARLNVAHVLEGSVRKFGNRVRISVQLIDARSDSHVWSETYERTLDDVFAIQDEIAAAVLSQLRVTLLGERLKTEETTPEVYQLHLEAVQARTAFTAEGLARAMELSERALAIDPGYTPAKVLLGGTLINQASAGLLPFDEGYTRARQLAAAAVAAEPNNAKAHDMLGWISRIYEGDLQAAARHSTRAMAASPGDIAIIGNTSQLLWQLGRIDEAILFLERAARLDPLNSLPYNNLALVHLAAGEVDNAIDRVTRVFELNPDTLMARFTLGFALLEQGDAAGALAEFERERSDQLRSLGCFMACPALGLQQAAAEALSSLITDRPRYETIYRASFLAYSGRLDEAFAQLDSFVGSGAAMSNIHRDFALRPLHSDPRWGAFLYSIGQAPEQLAAIRLEVALPN